MAKLVSKRYALSLFQAGLELKKTNDFNNELILIKKVFEQEKELIQILRHPKVSKNEKKSMLENIFKGKISPELINFLSILIDKRRETYIFEIIDQYMVLFNEHENIIKVTAVTAVSMDEEAQNKLKTVLNNKLKKKIELSNIVDKTIIGGVLLKVENKLIDGTVKGQLEAMGRAIQGTSL